MVGYPNSSTNGLIGLKVEQADVERVRSEYLSKADGHET